MMKKKANKLTAEEIEKFSLEIIESFNEFHAGKKYTNHEGRIIFAKAEELKDILQELEEAEWNKYPEDKIAMLRLVTNEYYQAAAKIRLWFDEEQSGDTPIITQIKSMEELLREE